jgi:MSHA biogenesis protein MshQ
MKFIRFLCMVTCLFGAGVSQAQTYSNKSEPWAAIDAISHTKINHNSSPINFYKPTGSNCGTSVTVIDDTITNAINIGFTFNYGGVDFTQVRVMTDGRLQFGANTNCGSGTDNTGSTIYAFDYPDVRMDYTMRIYGADLDPTAKVVNGVTVNGSYPTSCASNVQRYVSFDTTGSAPNRRFVVTWNNVPKWIDAGQIAGSFSMNIILEENGEFIFQYNDLIDVRGVPAQIGWQVLAPYDHDIKQTALSNKETAILYCIGRPVAQYQMEQLSWSTAAGQVSDTREFDRHGSRVGGVNTVAGGYACQGGCEPDGQGNLWTVQESADLPA